MVKTRLATLWLSLTFISILLTNSLSVNEALAQDGAESNGSVVHVVICWLKEPGNHEQRQTIIDTSKSLQSIPGVLSITAGTPLASERELVDDSFDVAISVTFKDQTAMKNYLVHPAHVDAVTNVLGPLVDKLLAYDYVINN